MEKKTNVVTWSFSCPVESIAGALARVLGAVDKRNTLPILSNVKIDVFLRGAIQFVATDLEVRAATECRATVPGSGGAACVPAELLKGVLSALKGDVSFSMQDDQRLAVEGNGRHFEIACFPAEEFPDPECNWDAVVCHFEPGVLPRLLRSVSHAVGQDINKNNLCGVYLCQDRGRLTAVATDGNRLSLSGMELHDVDLQRGFLIPSKAVRILSGIETGITVRAEGSGKEDNQIFFEAVGFDLTARLLDGDFPAYRRVIPEDHNEFFTVASSALAEAIDDVTVVNEGKAKGVTIAAPEELFGEALAVSALGANSVAKASVPCMGGTGYNVTANSRYLVQALKAIDGEAFVKYGGANRAILLVPVDHEGFDERLEILMPYGAVAA